MPKLTGEVKQFNSKRGFGHIKPDSGDEEVFVHWKAISTDDRWPKLERGTKVSFETMTEEKDGKTRKKAINVTLADGGKVVAEKDNKEYGEFRYPGVCNWFRGYEGKEGGFGWLTMRMDATIGETKIRAGDDIYVSRDQLYTLNPQNPKICGGMELEFLVGKQAGKNGKVMACEVTLPGGEPIGDLPARDPKKKSGKGKGKGKGKGAAKAEAA